ncbi:unnamed protein product [Amoebophrya sp. A25]|nr:unnamed protein product [Amoebophrya sp. A25]|eukprot:GSA25T00006811001.1
MENSLAHRLRRGRIMRAGHDITVGELEQRLQGWLDDDANEGSTRTVAIMQVRDALQSAKWQKLKEEQTAIFDSATVTLDVSLPPARLHEVEREASRLLEAMLLHYFPSVQGFLLSFFNVRRAVSSGFFHSNFSFCHTRVSFDCIFFNPRAKQMELPGLVKTVAPNYVLVECLGFFTVKLDKDLIRKYGFRFLGNNSTTTTGGTEGDEGTTSTATGADGGQEAHGEKQRAAIDLGGALAGHQLQQVVDSRDMNIWALESVSSKEARKLFRRGDEGFASEQALIPNETYVTLAIDTELLSDGGHTLRANMQAKRFFLKERMKKKKLKTPTVVVVEGGSNAEEGGAQVGGEESASKKGSASGSAASNADEASGKKKKKKKKNKNAADSGADTTSSTTEPRADVDDATATATTTATSCTIKKEAQETSSSSKKKEASPDESKGVRGILLKREAATDGEEARQKKKVRFAL